MKICWDNIEKLILTKNGNFRKGSHAYSECDACLYCNEPFLQRLFDSTHSKYCSRRCAGKDKIFTDLYRKRMSDNHADVSGDKNPNSKGGVKRKNIPLYDTYAHQLEPYDQCRRNDDPNILEVKCTYCGKWYVPTLKSVKYRLQGISGNDTNRLYCSNGCKHECPIFWQQKYYKGHQNYNSREVQPQLRQLTFTRDDYICVKCGSTGPLHCHHIDPVVSNPIESADVDNCITYCVKCHKEVHDLPGCKYNELKLC
jgi:hypothetical protein